MSFRCKSIALSLALVLASAAASRAEVNEIAVAQQYGVSFLPLMLMEKQGLVEKHAAAAGLADLKMVWAKVAGPSAMNDGLISNALQFARAGRAVADHAVGQDPRSDQGRRRR